VKFRGRAPWQASYSMAEQAAASIVHEIRQPLAAVIAYANAARRWLERTPPNLDEARKALTGIVSVGRRADEVIEGIRAIFKRDRRHLIVLDVNELILGVLKGLGEELQGHQITVQIELTGDPPSILGDSVQLQQVILNLVTNAIEAMSSLTGVARILRIKSELHESGGVLVSVEDSGAGIDPKDFERIFDAFFTTKSGGMGMGLSICRSIIEAHRGRLWASAGINHGSVFHLTLPKGSTEHKVSTG
jgi:signal transduction histidine kinase